MKLPSLQDQRFKTPQKVPNTFIPKLKMPDPFSPKNQKEVERNTFRITKVSIFGFKEPEERLSPNMGFKNLGAYQLTKKLEKVYSRVEVSPI